MIERKSLESSETKYDKWHQEMSSKEQEDVLSLPWYNTVYKLLPDLSGKRILEVGCGRGVFSNYLKNKYPSAQIIAVDFSESAIAIAKQKFGGMDGLNFQVANAENLPFVSNSFDYYVSCETLEHVLDPAKMILEIKRVLRADGKFIVTTENYLNAYLLVWLKCWLTNKPFESGCGVQPNENFFLYPIVKKMFRSAGLRLTHTQTNYLQWMVLPGVNPGRLCIKEIQFPPLKYLLKPFGRHATYMGINKTE
jgi:ubiquinone/menaquinone biosynthesis C-methylase UbiE